MSGRAVVWALLAGGALASGCGNDQPAPTQPVVQLQEAPPAPVVPNVPVDPTTGPMLPDPSALPPGDSYTLAIAMISGGHRVTLLTAGGAQVGTWTLSAAPTAADFRPAADAIPSPTARVSIAADRGARYDLVVAAMDALRTRGITAMSLAVEAQGQNQAQNPPPQPPPQVHHNTPPPD